jgi:hypothetical protein
MSTTASIFKQLSSARSETQKLLGYINEALSALEGSTMTINTPGTKRTTRSTTTTANNPPVLTMAARHRISLAQKRRWALIKKAKAA